MIAAVLADLVARAGGGQNFRLPSPSGGGGGGGGGGGFFVLPLFFGGGGIVGLLLLVLAFWLFTRAARGVGDGADVAPLPPPAPPPRPVPASGGNPGPAGPTSTASDLPYDDTHPIGVPERFRGETLPGSDASATTAGVADGLSAIRAHDPAFDENAFLSRVERAFFLVQRAWTERRPELSRQVMADSLWQQHRAQIEEYRSSGRRNVLEDLSIGRAEIVAAHSDASYDTITVRIVAACADYDVDEKGRVVRGDRVVREFVEDWVFQRSSSATTKPDGGTMAQRCPNCGAPLDLDLAGVCSYCRQPIMGGAYDWVLSRIDQVFV